MVSRKQYIILEFSVVNLAKSFSHLLWYIYLIYNISGNIAPVNPGCIPAAVIVGSSQPGMGASVNNSGQRMVSKSKCFVYYRM